MHAASAGHNDQARVRQRGSRANERARPSRRWRDMENRHTVQDCRKKHFKVHVIFVMPCRARKVLLSRGQTKDHSHQTEVLKNSFCKLVHIKTTNNDCCQSKFVSRHISLLVCCTAPNRVARRETHPQGSE